jgi:hypothetical protein
MNTFSRKIRTLLPAIAAVLVLGLLWMNREGEQFGTWLTGSWLALALALVVIGNLYLSRRFDRMMPWSRRPVRRFVLQLLASVALALCSFNFAYYLLKILFTRDVPAPDQLLSVNLAAALLTVPVFSLYYAVFFIRAWHNSQLEAERYQKESLRAQLESLKNHIDPHFLFNNLNILSSLIRKDPELSGQYLNRFSEVYRYMLQVNASEPIPLGRELAFAEQYARLLQVRFGEALRIGIDLPEAWYRKAVPPLCLQLLMENCIVHNTLSRDKPLIIEICAMEGDYLLVRNNLQVKSVLPGRSGSGLENIRRRYSFFSDRPVHTENDGRYFSVKIPVLNLRVHEGAHP